MKLKFKSQDFQTDAVNAVVDLFTGQDKRRSTFSVDHETQMNFMQNDFGIGNILLIGKDALRTNMHEIQKRNNLPLTDNVEEMRFCVEMETGTGKTYVYTKTIFELNKRYGFTKFIIVVPSVAIREGVYKSFDITREHFCLQYDNVLCRYFIYNSAKLSDVRQFAVSSNIEVMIINIDAFKKVENIINQAQDKLNGETAMRYIQDMNPVVIVDEPQSVDNTPKAREAIESLNPLCVLRYSATHREKINLLYRLTPVDAYQMGLVKQICVSSNQVAGSFNRPYIKLLSVAQEGGFKAKIELDVRGKDGKVSRKTVTREEAVKMVEHLQTFGYIRPDGSVPEETKKAVISGAVELPKELAAAKDEVIKVIAQAETVKPETLSGVAYTETVEQEKTVTYEEAAELINHFEKKGYVSKSGKMKDTMKNALLNGTLDLPQKFEAAWERFEDIISRADKVPPIRDASRDVVVRLNKKAVLSSEFMELWDKIKQKMVY